MKKLTKEQLEKLTTPRLLAYKNSWMKTHDTADWVDLCVPPNGWSKQHSEWKEHHALIKEILSTRENVK